jgi:monoamine oxidase
MDTYDLIIVGAGLAGLHCALRISEKNPRLHIAIAEAYGYVGGRATTYSPPEHEHIHWEAGAGRIHKSHKMILHYVERYSLNLIPISSKENWIKEGADGTSRNIWKECSEFIVTFLSGLKPQILATHTIQQLLEKTHGKTLANQLLAHFPYKSEVATLRADLALQTFEKEMRSNEDFFIIQEGFSALAKAMHKELESRGVRFFFHHRLSQISKNSLGKTLCKFEVTSLRTNRVILALDTHSLKQISPFSNLPALKYLKMEPLLRTYAIFKTSQTPVWFSGFNNIVTDSPIRHIIPINPKQGTIMISYTDGPDTKHWTHILRSKGEKVLEKEIMKSIRELFPSITIPDPIFFKAHDWPTGCTYWLPGLYNPKEMSKKIMQPFPNTLHNVFVCGESFSMRQAWVEGALEHSEEMLRKFFIK